MLQVVEREPEGQAKPWLTLVLIDQEADRQIVVDAGFKSVRLATSEESVCRIVNKQAVRDPVLEHFRDFVIAVRDPALRDGLAMRLDDTRCRWIDGDVIEQGPNAVRDAIAGASPMWTDEVCLLSDVPEAGVQRRYETGFAQLDEWGFRLVRPAFMPVIGPYGSGKSVLIRQLACNLYRMHGWRCLITAFEEKIKPRYVRDLRAHLIGDEDVDPNGELRWTPKHPSQWSDEDIAEADRKIEDGFRFLRRKRGGVLDADRLIDRIEYAVKVYGADVVVIDPVNEIDHQVPKGMSKTDYMGHFMMQLKALADDYNLLMIVCAHPPKDGTQRRGAKHLYTLADGADTAHYGNKADIGWCVWRPSNGEYAPTYLNIDKLKDHDVMGRPTLAKLMLDRGMGRFSVTRIGFDEIMGEIAGGPGD
jgi:twinkle protein